MRLLAYPGGSIRNLLLLVALAAQPGCGGDTPPSSAGGPSEPPEEPPGEVPAGGILFIGNSLTFANDLPGFVEAMADSAGIELSRVQSVSLGGFSLEDHWNEGTALEALRSGTSWDFVIMQQGPSGLPESRENLVYWARQWAIEIRKQNAVPVMYMVWPDASRMSAFDSVSLSYRTAAIRINGLLAPAADAWIEAWNQDPGIPLYGPDHFHPSVVGTYLAALTLSTVLFDRAPSAFPGAFTTPRNVPVQLELSMVQVFRSAVSQVTGGP
jgi:hypothetical protein